MCEPDTYTVPASELVHVARVVFDEHLSLLSVPPGQVIELERLSWPIEETALHQSLAEGL